MNKWTPSNLGDDECWEWTGYRKETGYGTLRHNGKTVRAHRVAFELSGVKIPEGMHVLHSCDNPPCVNPRHLRVGTIAENGADKSIRDRGPNPKIKNSDAVVIREIAGSMRRADIAKQFGISEKYVGKIVRGETRIHAGHPVT